MHRLRSYPVASVTFKDGSRFTFFPDPARPFPDVALVQRAVMLHCLTFGSIGHVASVERNPAASELLEECSAGLWIEVGQRVFQPDC